MMLELNAAFILFINFCVDSSAKNTFMSQFRRFSTQFTPEQVEKEALRAQRVAKLNSFPHEKVYNVGVNAPLCLTASVEEVCTF